MTLQQKNWSRTLLIAYTNLGRLCESIDALISDTAVNSFYSYGYVNENSSILKISNKIIALSNKKIDYINLKVVIEKALHSMPKQLAKILILRFVNKMEMDDIASTLNLNIRTFYRQLDKALNSFICMVTALGYSVEKLELYYADDTFFKSIYELITQESKLVFEQANVYSREKLINGIISEICAYI